MDMRFVNSVKSTFLAATICLAANAAVGETSPTLRDDLTRILADERVVLRSIKQNDVIVMTRVDSMRPKPKPDNLLLNKPASKPSSNFASAKAVPSKDQLRGMNPATGNSEWACLAEALYFEARGESVVGMFAVAEVIINRRASKRFPSSICAVVSQGAHRKNACQFSYKCDGHAEVYHEPRAYDMVGKIAKIALSRKKSPLTKGATFYHAITVRPKWSRSFSRTAFIGKHYFYRNPKS